MRVGPDGRLWAVNPENGYFGVAPGTSAKSNPNAMKMVERDTIFTNVAMTPDGDVWWEGMDAPPPDGLLDWQGRPWKKDRAKRRRIRTAASPLRCATIPRWSPHADDPQGVPISRDHLRRTPRHDGAAGARVVRLDAWRLHGRDDGLGDYRGRCRAVGVVRRDPMAMLPFCGYNMGDYFAHWLAMRGAIKHPPRFSW